MLTAGFGFGFGFGLQLGLDRLFLQTLVWGSIDPKIRSKYAQTSVPVKIKIRVRLGWG